MNFKWKKPKYETDPLREKTNLLHERNFQKFGFDFHPHVSLISGIIILAFLLYTLKDPIHADKTLTFTKDFITSKFNWFFVLTTNFFLIFPICLTMSKLGEVRLGGPEAKPEFSNFSWYSMLFSAGMGIGLVFWSVGEPLYHYNTLLPMFGNKGDINNSLALTFFHWGFQPWGIYALISLTLAFFSYNRGLPFSLRSTFYPIFKDKVFGIVGDIIDILAVIACLFGLATSLGFGAQQVNSGLNFLFNIPISIHVQVITICIITVIATFSVISGIGNGVKILSELNIKMAFLFLLFILFLGPTVFILRAFSSSLGVYLGNFIDISFWTEQGSAMWQENWTVFYWAWWISSSPYVGVFVAKISKGRTVREFVTAVVIIPAIISFIWMSVFGGTALHQAMSDGGRLFQDVNNNVSTALFAMISYMDIPSWLQIGLGGLGTFLIISFFVTSADSGAIVIDSLTSGGKEDSPMLQRIFWSFMIGAIAIALIVVGGSKALGALQTAVIISGLPFCIILLAMCFSLYIGLKKDLLKLKTYREDKFVNTIFSEKITMHPIKKQEEKEKLKNGD
ncbi:BCCT family transporter [uncultured Cetobacterium sp.]|uniref:BCCT family transporter n=1 Tax=uncultured Cetobacterium sp. TaxID=527638 RepID=UPI0026122D57|nr:BCCT family transporter [uncultured Cetobacterium sp.]